MSVFKAAETSSKQAPGPAVVAETESDLQRSLQPTPVSDLGSSLPHICAADQTTEQHQMSTRAEQGRAYTSADASGPTLQVSDRVIEVP